MDLFPRSDIFMFFAQWVSHPCVLKPLIYQGFRTSCYFTLVINTTVSTWPDCFGLMSIYCKCVPAVYGNLSNGRISRNVVKIQPCPFSKKCLSKDCKNTESRNNRFPYLNYFYFWETVILSSLSQFATSTIFIPSY